MSNIVVTPELIAQITAQVIANLNTAVVVETPKATPKAKPVKVETVTAPEQPKRPTLTKAALKELRAAGIVPRLTTQAQALAGVDSTGKPLSKECKAVLAQYDAPKGEMRAHFRELKESGAPRTPKADLTFDAKIKALVDEGGFTEAEARDLLANL